MHDLAHVSSVGSVLYDTQVLHNISERHTGSTVDDLYDLDHDLVHNDLSEV